MFLSSMWKCDEPGSCIELVGLWSAIRRAAREAEMGALKGLLERYALWDTKQAACTFIRRERQAEMGALKGALELGAVMVILNSRHTHITDCTTCPEHVFRVS